jgi:hypothetical protein
MLPMVVLVSATPWSAVPIPKLTPESKALSKVGTRTLLLSSAKFNLGLDKKDLKDSKSKDSKDSKTSRDSKEAPKEAAKAPAPFLQIPRGTALLLSQESPKAPTLIISPRGSAMDVKDSKAGVHSKIGSKSTVPSVSQLCTPVAAGSMQRTP